jgi:hypothetical protein
MAQQRRRAAALKAVESVKEDLATVSVTQKDDNDKSNAKLALGRSAPESKVAQAVQLPKSAKITAHTGLDLAHSTTSDCTVPASSSGGKKKVRKPKNGEKVAKVETNGQTTIPTSNKNGSETETAKPSQSLHTSNNLDTFEASVDMEGTKQTSLLGLPSDHNGPASDQKSDKHAAEVVPATISSSSASEHMEATVVPVAMNSWAGVCSPAPLRNISDSTTPQQEPVPKDATASSQTPTTFKTLSVRLKTPLSPPEFGVTSGQLAQGSNPSTSVAGNKSGDVQPASTPPPEKLQAVVDEVKHLVTSEMVLSEADFPALPPSSPPKTAASPSTSHARIAPASWKPDNTSPQKTSMPVIRAHSPVVNQPLDSLYVMIRQERQALLKGPKITIYSGTHAVTGIFKRAAMAVSSVLNAHFVKNPSSLEYHLSAEDTVTPGAIRYLLDTYLHAMNLDFEAHAALMQPTFSANITVLRAARKLGMEPYTRHILTSHVIYLKEHIPSYEEIDIIERNKTGEKDPLWTHMINHLCHARHHGYVQDPEEFEKFLEMHPVLKKAMAVTDKFFYGGSGRKGGEGLQRRGG